MSSSNKTTTNAQVSQTSAASTAAEQYWIPSFAHQHYNEMNEVLEVSCRCKTCRDKSVSGEQLCYGTVGEWIAEHNLAAWKDPLGSGYNVVAIKGCTEKFLEKVHPEKYANGTRFWMNFDSNRFDIRYPYKQKAPAEAKPAEAAPAEAVATAPKRPTIPPAPAVNPWSKGEQAHKADESATAELKKPLPKKEKKHHGPVKNGAWKKVDTELAPNSKSIVFNIEPAQNASASSASSVRVALFDLRLENPCQFRNECKYKTHTKTSKFVCPGNHDTEAAIIPKGEPIPEWLCPYERFGIVDGKHWVKRCKNKACPKDHLENHIAYCKGFDAKNSGATAMLAPQAVQFVYVLPNGQMMQGPPMMGPPTMPQFAPPRFNGKVNKQNKRRPPPPNYTPPKPKPKQELTDAEFEASLETEQVDSDQEDAELSAIDEEKKTQKQAWIMHPETNWDDIEKVCCRGQKCGNMTPEYCECPLPSDFEESESEDEDAILSRATVVAASQ